MEENINIRNRQITDQSWITEEYVFNYFCRVITFFVDYSNTLYLIKETMSSRVEPQYFYSFKASYDGSYEASEMICFTTQCNQNKTLYEALNE